MSEFKYACPVCGQHMMCDSSHGGSVMECPTCFQKIIAPQAPNTADPKFILTGTKVGERTASSAAKWSGHLVATRARGFPGAVVVLVIFVCIAAAVGFVYHGTIFKSTPPEAPGQPTTGKTASAPAANGMNWTLNLDAMTNPPDAAAAGRVHGEDFVAQRVILDGGTLTLRTQDYPPTAGVSIYLHATRSEDLAGQTVVIKPDSTNVPWVNLRWKDAEGKAVTQTEKSGYALRIEFGQLVDGRIEGKIYFCAPDDLKSYVFGTFSAKLHKPRIKK